MKLIPFLALVGGAGLFIALGGTRADTTTDIPDAQTSYYANGQIRSAVEVKDGRKDGLCRRYLPDGRLEAQGNYVAGKMEGDWSFWLADGTLDAARSGTYHDGEHASDAHGLSGAGGGE